MQSRVTNVRITKQQIYRSVASSTAIETGASKQRIFRSTQYTPPSGS